MSIHLITGHAGKAHIKAANHGAYNAAVVGKGQYVLDFGTMFEASVLSANKIRIYDGILLNQGRHIQIDPNTYEEVDIENGAQGYKRDDIIAMRYSKNAETDVESASLVVIKGTPYENGQNVLFPESASGDIINGAVISDMPLYRVPLDGLTVGELVPLFETLPNVETMHEDIETLKESKQNIVTGAASTITSSNLTKNRVMVTDDNGKATASSITTTLLGYLSGVTSSIQTQLNAMLKRSGGTMTGALNFANNVWNKVGDDLYMGDYNVPGMLAMKPATIQSWQEYFAGIRMYSDGLSWYSDVGMNKNGQLMIKCLQGDMFLGTSGAVYVSNAACTARAVIHASAFTQSSSRRLKENIEDMTDEEAKKLLLLNPVTYDYINKDNGTDCKGLIAEDAVKIIPSCVVGNVDCADDDESALQGIGIDYSKLVPYLIKMVQIQQAEIEALKEAIN